MSEELETLSGFEPDEVTQLIIKAKDGKLNDADRIRLLKGATSLLIDETNRAYGGLAGSPDHRRLELAQLLIRVAEDEPEENSSG